MSPEALRPDAAPLPGIRTSATIGHAAAAPGGTLHDVRAFQVLVGA